MSIRSAASLRAGFAVCILAAAAQASASSTAAAEDMAQARRVGALERVTGVQANYPAGIAVSHTGRLFISCPNQDGDVEFTLYEIKNEKLVPYPDEAFSRPDADNAKKGALVSIQALSFDAENRLWLLDSGFRRLDTPPVPGGARLMAMDIDTGRVVRTIPIGTDNGAIETTFLNDFRIDLGRGEAGTAYITDTAQGAHSALIVVDIATGTAIRRLEGHPSVQPEPGLRPIVEGQFLQSYAPGRPPTTYAGGVNGITISPDGKAIVYTPFTHRRLFSVSADALADPAKAESDVRSTVKDLGEKGLSGGLESDAAGNVYLSNPEQNAIFKRSSDGRIETVAYDPRLLWPDTMALGRDGYLYVTASQYSRRPFFQDGSDLRERPFGIYRIKVDARPVELGRAAPR